MTEPDFPGGSKGISSISLSSLASEKEIPTEFAVTGLQEYQGHVIVALADGTLKVLEASLWSYSLYFTSPTDPLHFSLSNLLPPSYASGRTCMALEKCFAEPPIKSENCRDLLCGPVLSLKVGFVLSSVSTPEKSPFGTRFSLKRELDPVSFLAAHVSPCGGRSQFQSEAKLCLTMCPGLGDRLDLA